MASPDDRNPYDILQVARDATTDDVHAAYRRLVRQHHPDISPDPDATTKMQDLNWARDTLVDPDKRRLYDLQSRVQSYRRAHPSGPQPQPWQRYAQPKRGSSPGKSGGPTSGATSGPATSRRTGAPGTTQTRYRSSDYRRPGGNGGASTSRRAPGSGPRAYDRARSGPAGPRARSTGYRRPGDNSKTRAYRYRETRSRPADEPSTGAWRAATGSTPWERSARRGPSPGGRSTGAASARAASGADAAQRTGSTRRTEHSGDTTCAPGQDFSAAFWELVGRGVTRVFGQAENPAALFSISVALVGVLLFGVVLLLGGVFGSGQDAIAPYVPPTASLAPTATVTPLPTASPGGQWIEIWGEAYREGIQGLVSGAGYDVRVQLGDRVFIDGVTRAAYFCSVQAVPVTTTPPDVTACLPIDLPPYLGGYASD